ncbi:MAG: hypothetical protein IZT55_02270 [Anaerolineae bacterium]|nr:hypothetical protein [Anaerolineae bacterium]
MMLRWRWLLTVGYTVLFLSLGLAWISSDFQSIQGWMSFYVVLLLGFGIIIGSWRTLKYSEQIIPGWMLKLVVGAALLRLITGAVWMIVLPLWGYGGDVESAGYVMSDAYNRDTAAWELAQSPNSLLDAFDGYRSVDQYGGLLFLSAALYRYIGIISHAPLLMIVLTASCSAVAVLFTWGFARRTWGKSVAKIAAWGVALYPEAILLGSSQMREAFTVTLAGMALYGLILLFQQHPRIGICYILLALTLGMPLSPTFTILLISVLAIVGFFFKQVRWTANWRIWAGIGVLVAIGLAGVFLFGDDLLPGGTSNPLLLLQEWIKNTARWQAYISSHTSGWMQKIFARTPTQMHLWILVAYGVVQPFLPAAIIAKGKAVWWGIAIWRAIGWSALLVLLVYAPIRALRKINRSIMLGPTIAVWMVILISALLGGGDQWDNPRYRAAFAGLQISLAAWVWVNQRRNPDIWMRRVLYGMGFVFLWFIPWYLRRYFPEFSWPVVDLFKTFGLGLASAVLFAVWDWAKTGLNQ